MGFSSAKEYEKAAAAVVANSSALHKKEAEDGDDVYYIESTNEFVIVSTDGYIRTYFNPDTGIAYYNRQQTRYINTTNKQNYKIFYIAHLQDYNNNKYPNNKKWDDTLLNIRRVTPLFYIQC